MYMPQDVLHLESFVYMTVDCMKHLNYTRMDNRWLYLTI